MTRLARPRALGPCLLLLFAASAAHAFVQPESPVAPGREDMLVTWLPLQQEPAGAGLDADLAAADEALRGFRAEAGGTWLARYDLRTGTPALVWGSGLPWIPGRGNDLDWTDFGRTSAPSEEELLAILEAKARELVARHPGLFRVPAGVDVVRHSRGAVALDGTKHQVVLGLRKEGVPVQDAYLVFRLSHGNLVQLGSTRISEPLAAAPVRPAVSAEQALDGLRADLALALTPLPAPGQPQGEVEPLEPGEVVDGGTLLLLPVAADPRRYEGAPGRGVAYRLAWRVGLRLPTGHETWISHRDAITGERLTLFDRNRYACPGPAEPQGRVTGGVYLGPIEEVPEEIRGMPFALVQNPNEVNADYNGLFPLNPDAVASTGLDGTFFDMNCVSCTGQMFVESGSGQLFFGFGGDDGNSNGFSTRAERNCYYHLNVVRQLARKNLTDADTNGYLNRNMPANVNIDASCNAFFDGNSVNFFKAGGGCNNTGEIADVMQHEWGHGLDFATLLDPDSFEGARSEGLSDIVAWLSTHDARLGPYFQAGNPDGIRNADETARGTLTVSNLLDNCPGGPGVSGGAVHCEGGIISQAFWHLGVNLRGKFGDVAGWWLTERLFFRSLPLSDSYLPNRTDSVYDAVALIDDDDGDLVNGTPNAAEINDAFSHHEIASDPRVIDSPECTNPPSPPVTLELLSNPLTDLPQVRVTWDALPNAVQYEVVRNDAGGLNADVPVATIFPPDTEFLDDNVTEGATYHYRVQAFDDTGCFTIGENQQSVVVPQVARFALASSVLDDFGAQANSNGVPEPGETIDLAVELRSVAGDATNVFATLSTTEPGVTVLQDRVDFGDLPGGSAAVSPPPGYRIAIDAAVECGAVLPFVLEIESDQGCSRERITLVAGSAAFVDSAFDDFETDAGWTVDPDGTDDATTGIWVREDPNGTGAQPEDDASEDGTQAWVTGNGVGGGDGFDDVDDGCTTLRSPVYDLGGVSGLVLAYQRHFAWAAAPGDQLEFDISNDGGANWLPVERLSDPTGGWQQAVFSLDDLLGEPADRIVFQARACDLNDGTLFEAGLDDFRIAEPITVCEAPQPTPRVELRSLVVGDDISFGGFGNGNGRVDPGEVVRLALDVENLGNGEAVNGRATLTLLDAPAEVVLTDDTTDFDPVAPLAVQRSGADALPHFEIDLPRPGVACEGTILVGVVFDYEDGAGNAWQAQGEYLLNVGEPGGGPVREFVFGTDFEAPGAGADWVSGEFFRGDDWHFGQVHPGPDLRSDWDPPSCHSGEFCWGNDLGGTRDGNDWNGNYRRNSANFLDSPSFDLSGVVDARIGFWRWLTVEQAPFDRAVVQVNGVEVWSNPTGQDLLDDEWVWQEIDISAVADDNPDVRIRWILFADGGLQYGGWTIDGFQIFSRWNGCEGARGCEIFPAPEATGPVLRATGVKSDTSVEFGWTELVTAPPEARFVLYRGTAPDLLDTVVTPADWQQFQYEDETADAGLYFYRLVMADCDGIEGPATP